MIRHTDVVVIGAGVSGLTSALRLAESGFSVHVRSAEPPGRTTSCTAGAIWGPHLVAHERALAWALRSLAVFRELATDPRTGVRMVDGVEASRGTLVTPRPGTGPDDVRRCDPATLPPTFTNGWRYRVPLIDMSRYLEYLSERLDDLGVEVTITDPVTAAELPRLAPLVVNCTGLGARELIAGDPVAPVRGDLLVAENPGLDQFFVEHDDDSDGLTTYLLPQGDRVMLGGSRSTGDWSTARNPEVADAILARCTAAEPRLAGVRILEHHVGLRPVREQVRIGPDETHPHVLHNYGHGGGGVTLSWGCAQEVLECAGAAVRTSRPG
ncbi:FAD-dependent oxidoreductase [Actinoplanes regularis]|uniref:D-amino-acid oxidase n=1 Tax=Actinoplanes regularis TaxID=52697 RepID=A0A238WIX5_9ACTN|nr:FAD-dependent oxidoreductase [Actinoplanes regularis]GIE84845.1 amino acid oxidase [Actinoplanes regularis]GLW32465.1 amino acid oxidase [Actinoplanes regularis]SNR46398.1 D-amino-acid:oxygen oxidoreductase [Actinoplanes regularis]